MTKKLTISVSDEVYEGLHRHVGRRRISRCLNDLAKRHVLDPRSGDYWSSASDEELARGYAEAAKDEAAEREATEWIEALVGETLDDEDFSDWPGYPSR
jgi:predicted CopG family antitoxin